MSLKKKSPRASIPSIIAILDLSLISPPLDLFSKKGVVIEFIQFYHVSWCQETIPDTPLN